MLRQLNQNGRKLRWLVLVFAAVSILTAISVAWLLGNQSYSQVWDLPPYAVGGAAEDSTTGQLVWFDPPPFVDITQIFLIVPQAGVLQVGLKTAGPIPLSSQDRFCYDFYFDGDGDGMWDVIVFSTHGSYTYDSSPPKPPNSAGVMDLASGVLLGDAQVSVSENTLTITLDHSLVNNSTRLLAVVSHFLPSNLSGSHGLTDTDAWVHPDLAMRMVGFRGHELVE